MSRRRKIPGYCHHKPSDQAYTRVAGHTHYLGRFGTPESKQRYDELIAAWLQGTLPSQEQKQPASPGLLVRDVCVAFLEHADRRYRKRGEPTYQPRRIAYAFAVLVPLYGATAAVAFGPKALKAVREAMISRGWGRGHINTHIGVIKQAWSWAVEEELLPGTCAHALRAVKSIPAGSGVAPEGKKVKPVPWPVVEATLPHLPPQLADAVRLQHLAGMRPCEVLAIRPCDIDHTGVVPDGPTLPGVWVYVVPPEWNKLAHKGKVRIVLLGPAAQELLRPYVTQRSPEEYVFSPIRAEQERQKRRAAARKTPRYRSHQKANRAKRKARPKRRPGAKYPSHALTTAIRRAAEKAGVPLWAANQLRHSRATELRRVAGLDHAGTILGHANLTTTEVYADRDLEAAAELVRRVG